MGLMELAIAFLKLMVALLQLLEAAINSPIKKHYTIGPHCLFVVDSSRFFDAVSFISWLLA